MSEEKVQDNVQENLGLEVENKTENADSGLLQELMKYKSQRNEEREKNALLLAEKDKARQKQLSEDGKKDELIAELNMGREEDKAELERLRKYEEGEKTTLIASIASDEAEAETLSKESLSTLRLLKNKIATAKAVESPTARGSIGKQPPPEDWTTLSSKEGKERWSDILAAAQRKLKN